MGGGRRDRAARLPAPAPHHLSSDFDFFQLHDPPRVFAGCAAKPGVQPHEVRLYKTLVGDPSDSIPGIPGFGPKTWERCDREAYLRLVRGEDGTLVDAPPRVRAWLDSPDNRRLLRTMWQVVGFLPVPEAESDAFRIRVERGDPSPAVVEYVLRQLLI